MGLGLAEPDTCRVSDNSVIAAMGKRLPSKSMRPTLPRDSPSVKGVRRGGEGKALEVGAMEDWTCFLAHPQLASLHSPGPPGNGHPVKSHQGPFFS